MNKTDQETQSPVLKIFTDMLARDKSFSGYRDPEKASLLRAEHKKERDIKRDERRGDDRNDEGKRDESDRRPSKKNKKPRTNKKRSSSNPKKKEKKKVGENVSCHCPKSPAQSPPMKPLEQATTYDNTCCQTNGNCKSSSREDAAEDNMDTKAHENDLDQDGDRGYERERSDGRVRERHFKKKMDDTCSCASCVSLKKMCRNDCICCCCVAFLFILCLFMAFVLVCKSIPCLRSKFTVFGVPDEMEGDRLKRKIDVPTDMQWGELDKKHQRISNKWDYDRLPSHPIPHSMDSGSYGDTAGSHESELMKVIDSNKLSEIQGSERLREFYKKLLSTDAQIRKLKKKDYLFNIDNSDGVLYPERVKRSLGLLKKPFRMFHNKRKNIKETITESKGTTEAAKVTEVNVVHEKEVTTKQVKDARIKRYDSNEEGLLIEKKMSIQFMPHIRRTSKCTHAPKEINSYEKPEKNPFYQNTQRLDKLLEKFLDKNVMELTGHPYTYAVTAMKKCKHKNKNNEEKKGTPIKKVIAEKGDAKGDFEANFNDAKKKLLENTLTNNINSINKNIQQLQGEDGFKTLDDHIKKNKLLVDNYKQKIQQTDTEDLQDFMNNHSGNKIIAKVTTAPAHTESAIKENTPTTTNNYNLLMSISTMMFKDEYSAPLKKNPAEVHKPKERVLVGRRLMQTEMDDDEEVSVMAATERDGERKKRRDDDTNPRNLINPNWKGPMPLYPDELNSIVKPGHVIANTEDPITEAILVKVTKNNKGKSHGTVDTEDVYLTDMEYIEDYFRNKYDRIAEMAQAYSDYGVLNDKNVQTKRVDERTRNDVKIDVVKSAIDKPVNEKSSTTIAHDEGFKVDVTPNPYLDGMIKSLKKHIKFTSEPERISSVDKPLFTGSTFETTKGDVLDVKNILNIEKPTSMELEFRSFKKRSLKNVDYYHNDDQSAAIESLMNFRGIFNGIQKKFSSKIGSAQDYAIQLASDYIHDTFYKRDVGSVDIDSMDDNMANDTVTVNITCNNNTTDNNNTTNIDKIKDIVVKLVTNDTYKAKSTAQVLKDAGVTIATDVRNDTGSSLSDFFMNLAHWFSLLDTFNLSINKNQTENFSAPNNPKKTKDPSKFELSFPLYDTDMIENIGHRSRVLLAVNETEQVESTSEAEEENDLAISLKDLENSTTAKQETVNDKENKSKVVVKRNAVSDLVFWDDIYDEEYGVDIDNIVGNDADKNLQSDRIKPQDKKRPNDWFKRIVDKFKESAARFNVNHDGANKERADCRCGKRKEGKNKTPKMKANLDIGIAAKRFYRKADSDYPEEKKTDFIALTNKMKKICQKAARDISLSKKLEVREESKEGQVASKLMQQLISLMSDLVDYQVHEKTCRKLPVDLQNFLEWLTNPESSVTTYHGKDTILPRNHKERLEEIQTLDAMPPGEDQQEPKGDCMSIMQAVRDLMNRYDCLSDDDKSKMNGVKEYLERQKEYLQKQMYLTNEFNVYNPDISRYKRELGSKAMNSNHHYGKTNSFYDHFKKYVKQHKNDNKINNVNATATVKKKTKKPMTIAVVVTSKGPVIAKTKNDKSMKKITKKNLRDVYYRALEVAKLTTNAATAKSTDY